MHLKIENMHSNIHKKSQNFEVGQKVINIKDNYFHFKNRLNFFFVQHFFNLPLFGQAFNPIV